MTVQERLGAAADEEISPSQRGLFMGRRGLHGRCVSTSCSQPAGLVLATFRRSVRRMAPDAHTVQRGPGEHLHFVPGMLGYINHSCGPNIVVDVDRREIVALRPIAAGEELVFFYPSTEWAMAAPFECVCGSPLCIGRVAGARSLPASVLGRYRVSRYVASAHAGLGLRPTGDPAGTAGTAAR